MRTALLLAPLAVLSLTACGGDDDDPTPTQPNAPLTATVAAAGDANTFTPTQVTIARGGTVTWTFGARIHNVTFNPVAGAPATVPDASNTTVARTFASTGSFPYECTRHTGMTGSVVVQ